MGDDRRRWMLMDDDGYGWMTWVMMDDAWWMMRGDDES